MAEKIPLEFFLNLFCPNAKKVPLPLCTRERHKERTVNMVPPQEKGKAHKLLFLHFTTILT
jgi:hypothetical protein